MKNSKKPNLMLRLASLLLVCVLVSTYALSGLLARYTTSTSAEDSARVAKFDVSVIANPIDDSVNLTSDYQYEYAIILNNNSEVAVECDVVITFEETLENCYSLKLNGKNPTVSSDKKVFTFDNVKELEVGKINEKIDLIIVVDYETWAETATNQALTKDISFNTEVKFAQID